MPFLKASSSLSMDSGARGTWPDGWLESLQKPKGSLEGQKRQLGPGIPQEPRWSARLHKKQLTIKSSL